MRSNSATHETIARRAYEIWQGEGSPDGRDTEFWFEAERELAVDGAQPVADSGAGSGGRGDGLSPVRERDGLAAPGTPVHHSGPAVGAPSPDDVSAKSFLQKKEARAPHLAASNAPKAMPPESGKPLWDKPHSK